MLAAGLSSPFAIRASSSDVYWISVAPTSSGSTSRLKRCPLAGCGGMPAESLGDGAVSLEVDDAFVYWTTSSTLQRCPVTGSCAPSPMLDLAPSSLGSLAAGGGGLRVGVNDFSGASGRIMLCPLDGCGASPAELYTGETVGAIAVAGDDIVFLTGTPSVKLRSVRGGAASLLGTLPGLPTALAASGSTVLFVSQRTLYHCEATTSCTPVPFDAKESTVYGVATAGADVFYSVSAAGGVPGKILRCPAQSCTSPTVVLEAGNPGHLTVRDGWVYFTDLGGGSDGQGSVRRVRY